MMCEWNLSSIAALACACLSLAACGASGPGEDDPPARDMSATSPAEDMASSQQDMAPDMAPSSDPPDMSAEVEDMAPAEPPAVLESGVWEGAFELGGASHDASATLVVADTGEISGALVVALDRDDPEQAKARRLLTFEVGGAQRDARSSLTLGSPRCTELEGDRCAGVLAELPALELTGRALGDGAQFTAPSSPALTLTPPGEVLVPNDGFRPHSPQGGGEAQTWPPRLYDRPREVLLTGTWSGRQLSLTPGVELRDPLRGGVCMLYVYADRDGALNASGLECSQSPEFNSGNYYETLERYTPQAFTYPEDESAASFTIARGEETLRYDGRVSSAIVERGEDPVTRHRLYHLDGVIEREVSPGSWEVVGAFAFVSWGDEPIVSQ